MTDSECVEFLQWALPRMGFRWAGFRRVRRQVCKRISRRLRDLGMEDEGAYRDHLRHHPEEWEVLDRCCRVTISRFLRDRQVFFQIAQHLLPVWAGEATHRGGIVRAWSAGCGSGEEPYSLVLTWAFLVGPAIPDVRLEVVATDADPHLLWRASRARFGPGSLRELPPEWMERAFVVEEDARVLRPEFTTGVRFELQDLRREMPSGSFDLVLCRNLAFTYFTEGLQRQIMEGVLKRLRAGGALVIGGHESLPEGDWPLRRSSWPPLYLRGESPEVPGGSG